MRANAAVWVGLLLSLIAARAPAERYVLSPEAPLEIHTAPDAGGGITLPAHAQYLRVIEENGAVGGWLEVRSLPSVFPAVAGWVRLEAVEVYDTAREARHRYFATHPLLPAALPILAALAGGYWDLREQGAEVEARPPPWLRYGFDFDDWWVVRGQTSYAEIRDVADIVTAGDARLVLTLFSPLTTTPPETLEIQIIRDGQVRIIPGEGPAYRFGRTR